MVMKVAYCNPVIVLPLSVCLSMFAVCTFSFLLNKINDILSFHCLLLFYYTAQHAKRLCDSKSKREIYLNNMLTGTAKNKHNIFTHKFNWNKIIYKTLIFKIIILTKNHPFEKKII